MASPPRPPAIFFALLAALLYLNPALLSSAILTAVLNGNGELGKLLAFGVGKDSKASEDDP